MKLLRFVFRVVIVIMPWPIRASLLRFFFGYNIHPTARIRFSWIFPRELDMGENTSIGPFTVAIHLDALRMEANSRIGRRNWITGFPTGTRAKHFQHQEDRVSELVLGQHAAITKNHHFDCTSTIYIGAFTTIAGYGSQFLTHSIDIKNARQDSAPITIGAYSFVSTRVTILGGSVLPDRSVLGACALLNKPYSTSHKVYAGIPAKIVSDLSESDSYFNRSTGFVH